MCPIIKVFAVGVWGRCLLQKAPPPDISNSIALLQQAEQAGNICRPAVTQSCLKNSSRLSRFCSIVGLFDAQMDAMFGFVTDESMSLLMSPPITPAKM